MKNAVRLVAALICLSVTQPAYAIDNVGVQRDANGLVISWTSANPVDVYVSDNADASIKAATRISVRDQDGRHDFADKGVARHYFILRDTKDGQLVRVAERQLPLEKGSNFRDLGGYVGAGGKRVKWGHLFRSGAMPLLSENDYGRLSRLGIKSIIDLRSVEERSVAPTQLDDRTGALFLSNDYSLKSLMANYESGNGENVYKGMEKMLAPQFRALFQRLLANDGAVLYNCSAGQDRTGIATALVLSALGVDRKTILADYHLSTALRRPENELPKLDPRDHPGNPIVGYYAQASAKPGGAKAEPLYSKTGHSHLAQFFEYLDGAYGGVDSYLAKELGVGPLQIMVLRKTYLQ